MNFVQSDSWPLAPGKTGPEAVPCPFFPFIKPSQQWSRCLSWNSVCFYHSVFRIQYCLLRGLIRRKQGIGQLKMIPNHVLKIRHCWGYPGSLAFFRCTQIAVLMSEGFMHVDIPGGCSPMATTFVRMDLGAHPADNSSGLQGAPFRACLSGTNLPSRLPPMVLSPSIYSPPCLLAAGSSPGAGGAGGSGRGWAPSPWGSSCLLHQAFKTHSVFSSLVFCYTNEAYLGPVKEESFINDRCLFLPSAGGRGRDKRRK